jgi:hypothetical protein
VTGAKIIRVVNWCGRFQDSINQGAGMRRAWLSICLAFPIIGCIFDVRADERDPKAEIQALFDRLARAFDKKDIDGVNKTSLANATVKYADGTELTVAQWKEHAPKIWAHVKKVKSRIVVKEVKLNGDQADVTYTETHDSTVVDPQDRKEHEIRYEGQWRVTMKKTKDGWRLSRSVELERRISRDGKRIETEKPKDKSKS